MKINLVKKMLFFSLLLLAFSTASHGACPCSYTDIPDFLVDKLLVNFEIMDSYEIIYESTPLLEARQKISEMGGLTSESVKQALKEIYGDPEMENKIHRRKIGEIFSLQEENSLLFQSYKSICKYISMVGEEECILRLSPSQIKDICFVSLFLSETK